MSTSSFAELRKEAKRKLPAPLEPGIPRIFVIDISGSIHGFDDYHAACLALLENHYDRNRGDVLIFWDHDAFEVTLREAMDRHQKRLGRGGNDLRKTMEIVHGIAQKKNIDLNKSHVVLVTDGEIQLDDVISTDEYMKEHKIVPRHSTGYVIAYAPNISCCAPLIRNSPHEIHAHKACFRYRQTTLKESPIKFELFTHATRDELDLVATLSSINTVKEFEEKLDVLNRILTAKMTGSGADQLIYKHICDMQTRILNSRTDEEKERTEDECTMMIRAFEDNETEEAKLSAAMDVARMIASSQPIVGLDAKIQTLLTMANGALRNVFDVEEIKSNRVARADIEDGDFGELPDDASVHHQFVCPILYDLADDPVILLTAEGPEDDEYFENGFGSCKFSYHSAIDRLAAITACEDRAATDKILNCPLDALGNKAVMDRFTQMLDAAVLSLSAITKEVNGTKVCCLTTSPMSRRRIIGFVPLGANKQSVEIANRGLGVAFRGSRKMGNNNLWFAAFWLALEKKLPHTGHLQELLPAVRAQMKYRLDTSKCAASLSGNPTTVKHRLLMKHAVWYCLAEPFFAPDLRGDTPKFQSALRTHLAHVYNLLQLQDLSPEVPLPRGAKNYIQRLVHLQQCLIFKKRLVTWTGTSKFGNRSVEILLRICSPEIRSNFIKLKRSEIDPNYQKNLLLNTNEEFGACLAVLEDYILIPTRGKHSAENSKEFDAQFSIQLPNILFQKDPARTYAYFRQADPSQAAADLDVPLKAEDDEGTNLPLVEYEWDHFTPKVVEGLMDVEICPATLRPLFDLGNDQTWRDALGDLLGATGEDVRNFRVKFVSEVRALASLYMHLGRVPTIEEMCLFITRHNFMRFGTKLAPESLWELARNAIDRFVRCAKAAGVLDNPALIQEIFKVTAVVAKRQEMEAEWHKEGKWTMKKPNTD